MIVVVCGNSGHGKDAFADAVAGRVQEEHAVMPVGRCTRCAIGKACGAARISFADPMKRAAEHLLGMPRRVAWGTQAQKDEWKRYGRSAREWLRWLGTEVGRQMVDPNVWVDRFAEDAVRASAGYVVASDGRFRSEIEGLRGKVEEVASREGRVVPSVRHVLIIRTGVREPETAHASETEIAEIRKAVVRGEEWALGLFDRVMWNDADLDCLRLKARAYALRLLAEA